MFWNFFEALSPGISNGKSYGWIVGVLIFLLVIYFKIRQKNDQTNLKELSAEEQHTIQTGKDDIQFLGTAIGVIGAIIISIYIIVNI
jgi:hypothetical protein